MRSQLPFVSRHPPVTSHVLRTDDVHVWSASLDVPTVRLQVLRSHLSEDELDRAGRFRVETHRTHYVAARGLLREILGRYADMPAGALRFAYNTYGKPALASDSPIRFNLSHSDGVALYAVTLERKVGIDIEHVWANVDIDTLAQRYFSPRECAALCTVAPDRKREAFFTTWTRKEAYIKAVGRGLAIPLNTFAVSVLPTDAAALLYHETNPEEVSRWSLEDVPVSPGYVATVAVEGMDWHLTCFHTT